MTMISEHNFYPQPFLVPTAMEWQCNPADFTDRHKLSDSSLSAAGSNPYDSNVLSGAFFINSDHHYLTSSPASSCGPESPKMCDPRYAPFNNGSPASTSMQSVSIFPHTAFPSFNTPSSASSISLNTPLSPPHPDFTFTDLSKSNTMDYDDIDSEMDDSDFDDDDLESDFGDDLDGGEIMMEGVSRSLASMSALEGALGHYSRSQIPSAGPSQLHPQSIGVDNRRMSMSAPGHPRAPYPQLDAEVHHAQQQANNYYHSHSNHHSPYPYPQHTEYTHVTPSSTVLFAPLPGHLTMHHQTTTSSHPAPSHTIPANSYNNRRPPTRVPIFQPQPVRPIPPIPISDLAAVSEGAGHSGSDAPDENRLMKSEKSPGLSPLSLLCQPVSDAVRYQLKTTGDVTGNVASDPEGASGTELTFDMSSVYPSVTADNMMIPSELGYFDSQSHNIKHFHCDCGCMGAGLGS